MRAAGCTGPASAPCDFARVCWGRVTPGEGRHWTGANPLPQRRRASHRPACVLLPLPPPQPGLNPDSPLESAATSAHDPASLSQGLVCRVEAELLPREPRTAQVSGRAGALAAPCRCPNNRCKKGLEGRHRCPTTSRPRGAHGCCNHVGDESAQVHPGQGWAVPVLCSPHCGITSCGVLSPG